MTSDIERMEARFQRQDRCPYPALFVHGLDCIWVGPGRSDFAPEIMEGVKAFLGRFNRSNQQGDCITSICNKIDAIRYESTAPTWLEQRYREGREILKNRAAPLPAAQGAPLQGSPNQPPPRIADLPPEEQAAALAALEAAKRKLRKYPEAK